MKAVAKSLLVGSLVLVVLSNVALADTQVKIEKDGVATSLCASLLGDLEACAIRKAAAPSTSCQATSNAASQHCSANAVALTFFRGLVIGNGRIYIPVDPISPNVVCTGGCTCDCQDSEGDVHTISGDNCYAGNDSDSDAHCQDNGSDATVQLNDCQNSVRCMNN
jgi:hypothetical protein